MFFEFCLAFVFLFIFCGVFLILFIAIALKQVKNICIDYVVFSLELSLISASFKTTSFLEWLWFSRIFFLALEHIWITLSGAWSPICFTKHHTNIWTGMKKKVMFAGEGNSKGIIGPNSCLNWNYCWKKYTWDIGFWRLGIDFLFCHRLPVYLFDELFKLRLTVILVWVA